VAWRPSGRLRDPPDLLSLMCDGHHPRLRERDRRRAPGAAGRPVSSVLRHYDSELIRGLQHRGFAIYGTQVLLVRDLASKVRYAPRRRARSRCWCAPTWLRPCPSGRPLPLSGSSAGGASDRRSPSPPADRESWFRPTRPLPPVTERRVKPRASAPSGEPAVRKANTGRPGKRSWPSSSRPSRRVWLWPPRRRGRPRDLLEVVLDLGASPRRASSTARSSSTGCRSPTPTSSTWSSASAISAMTTAPGSSAPCIASAPSATAPGHRGPHLPRRPAVTGTIDIIKDIVIQAAASFCWEPPASGRPPCSASAPGC